MANMENSSPQPTTGIGFNSPTSNDEYGEKLNPHPTTQRDFDLRLIALAAQGYLAYADGAENAENYKAHINPRCLAESLDRLGATNRI